MDMTKEYNDALNPEINRNPELTANRYALRCLTITMIMVAVIWVLNATNIFIINKDVTNFAFASSLVCYVVGLIICYNCDMSKLWVKYFIMLWTAIMITCITSSLTYHAVIASVVPIVFTCVYSSKYIRWYTVVLMIISNAVTVFAGYHFGICDANMVLLTKEPLAEYITASNTFSLSTINDNIVFTLTLFYIFPRSILYTVLAIMCGSISRIVTSNTNYATKMRRLAERDQMTGAYTKTKYLSMIEKDYINEEHIGIIFWDVNYLKQANDTLGHEYGDRLIVAICDSIRALNNENDKTYRIGGDEFVMVMRGATEGSVKEKVDNWNAAIKHAQPIDNIPLSASCGYAWGEGKNINQIIRDADQMMYENKRRYHENTRW